MKIPVVWVVYQPVLCWRQRCTTVAVTRCVQYGTVAALRNSGKSKLYKSVISVPYRQSGSFVSGNRNCDGSSMLRCCGAVLDVGRRDGMVFLHK